MVIKFRLAPQIKPFNNPGGLDCFQIGPVLGAGRLNLNLLMPNAAPLSDGVLSPIPPTLQCCSSVLSTSWCFWSSLIPLPFWFQKTKVVGKQKRDEDSTTSLLPCPWASLSLVPEATASVGYRKGPTLELAWLLAALGTNSKITILKVLNYF